MANKEYCDIQDKLEKINLKLQELDIKMSNHLHHHELHENWWKWSVPVGLSILIPIILFILTKLWG